MTFSKRISGLVPCDAALAYEILTDYDAYSEWMPLMASSKLLAREGELAIAEFAVFKPDGDKLVMECIHSKNTMVLGRRIEGKFPLSKIQWDLAPADAGQCQVALTIELRYHWRWVLTGCRRFLNVARLLAAFRSQVAVFAPEMPIAGQEGEKILELLETNEGIVVWLRGRKYVLQPAPEENHD